MKRFFSFFGAFCSCVVVCGAYAVSAGTVANSSVNGMRAGGLYNANTINAMNNSNTLRGNQGLANAYQANMRNSYYMVNVPDVDSACRQKIYGCLSDYCGDVTVVPGKQSGRCATATESELYNYALLCLQKDTSVLLPQYGVNTKTGVGGLNTAAQLCPKYVQQEVMSYLSMAIMADQLTKTHSNDCLLRRQELAAAMSCHSVALAYGNETTSMLRSQLNDFCGAGVQGGSAEMVTKFANAGNVGANIWGWAEKVVTLDVNKKGAEWEKAVDAVLASYTNRMNLACGDNLQLNLAAHTSGTSQPSAIQSLAMAAIAGNVNNAPSGPTPSIDLYMEVVSASEIYDAGRAFDVVNAAIGTNALTANSFLTSAQMDSMQKAYIRGTKVFVLRDSARCYVVPVAELSVAENSVISNAFSGCIYR